MVETNANSEDTNMEISSEVLMVGILKLSQ
jgi:hypothetical protein